MTENLRRIELHRRVSNHSNATLTQQGLLADGEMTPSAYENLTPSHQKNLSADTIETARQLFEEQLEFLDKEKAKLLQELPPLAPVASSEDLSSDEAVEGAMGTEKENEEGGKRKRELALANATQKSQEEYALDLSCPPILSRLPHLCKSRPRKCAGMRGTNSAKFIAEWRQRTMMEMKEDEKNANE